MLGHAPRGPGTECPASQVLSGDGNIAGPVGQVAIVDGKPHRFAQNVYPVYGEDVRAFKIHELSKTSYVERQVGAGPIIGPGSDKWTRHGMHHVDAHQLDDGSWLACVDGCYRRDFDESLLAE